MKHTAHPISGLDGFQKWGALFIALPRQSLEMRKAMSSSPREIETHITIERLR